MLIESCGRGRFYPRQLRQRAVLQIGEVLRDRHQILREARNDGLPVLKSMHIAEIVIEALRRLVVLADAALWIHINLPRDTRCLQRFENDRSVNLLAVLWV